MFRLFWTLCLGATLVFLQAQELPHVLHFDKAKYGAQNQNWAVSQAEDGTLFFANNAGLLEFDGAQWRLYALPEGQVLRTVLYLDGRVYVGGFGEFGYFERNEKMRWQYQSLSKSIKSEAAQKEEFWHILAQNGARKQIIFQSFSKIFTYDLKNTRELKPPSNLMFIQQLDERLVFQGIGQGLFELLPDGGFKFMEGSELLKNTIVAFIISDGRQGMLIGTKKDGIFRFDGQVCKAWDNALNPMLKPLQPNKAVRLRDGSLAIGTILDGVYIFDAAEQKQYHINQTSGLQNNTVLSMHGDKAGNLWVGMDKGIDLIDLNTELQWYNDLSGRLGTVYSAVAHRGHLYIGTNQGVFYKPWPQNVAQQPFQFVQGTQGQVWDLQVFDDQLLCGHNDGTFVIRDGRANVVSTITGGWQTKRVPNRNDLLLQGTYSGLIIFAKNEKGDWQWSHRIENFGDPARRFDFDEAGNLWVAHPNRGLWKLKLDSLCKRVSERKQMGADDGLPSDIKLGIIKHGDKLFFQNSAHLLNYEANRFLKASVELPTSGSLIALGRDHLFAPNANEVLFKSDSGLVHLPIELVPDYENIVLLGKDTMLFCLENGYVIWHRKSPKLQKNAVNALKINAIEIVSDPVRWWYPIDNKASIDLGAKENNLHIYCSAPQFTNTSHITWQLSGATARSGTLERSGFIALSDLPDGQYTLQLSAADAATVVYTFNISAPWWRTWPALLCWLALGVSLVFVIEHFNRRRLKKQREILQKEKERELEIQRQAAEKEMMQAELDNKNRELSNATLNLIRKNETLSELKNELQDINLPSKDSGRLDRLIENHLSGDSDWQVFESAFNQVHDDFFKTLKHRYPELTPGDLRLAALLKLNLASKELASLLGISVRGIENKRYRLRKKMGLSDKDNLTEVLMGF